MTVSTISHRINVLVLMCFLFLLGSFSQNDETVNEQLLNSEVLFPFFLQLDAISEQDKKVAIVHIGDSHIQADFLTGEVRRRLQACFGNAGRGFVFPYRIANSGGALDVRFTHTGTWQYCSILREYASHDMGAAGFTVTASPSSSFSIDVASRADSDARFTKVTFLDKCGSFSPSDVIGLFTQAKENTHTTICFDQQQERLSFKPTYEKDTTPELQGIVLENNNPGVLYHAMGINGSTVSQYLRSENFEQQIKELNARLVIISFGTNDCYLPSKNFCVSCVKEDYRKLIQRLRKSNDGLPILITTPPDHFYRRKYANKNVATLVDALKELAVEEQVAVWDLYGSMGGSRSILEWHKDGEARGDLIHFTQEGYRKQGKMLYDALMSHYEQR
ncbi:MAG: lysophospholipase L1-like esterase [Bacteroidia bacterium]|jgi:lysophospholipase L1-like esterase